MSLRGWDVTLRRWAPEYDAGRFEEDAPAEADVDLDVEVPADHWRPLRPQRPAEASLLFVDGVQRIDGWADLVAPGGDPQEALLASVAAGAVRAGERAEIVEIRRERAVHCRVDLPDLGLARHGVWRARLLRARDRQLEDGVSAHMNELEVAVAAAVARGQELVVLDGPLRHRDHLPDAVGYIKSHRVAYLQDASHAAVVAALAPGERTPLFALATRWDRFAWYARLTSAADAPWTGVIRGEASARLGVAAAATLADRATVTLGRFASSPIKDARAPQNLIPIGGLESRLRHRLGDREVLERALRATLGALPGERPGG